MKTFLRSIFQPFSCLLWRTSHLEPTAAVDGMPDNGNKSFYRITQLTQHRQRSFVVSPLSHILLNTLPVGRSRLWTDACRHEAQDEAVKGTQFTERPSA